MKKVLKVIAHKPQLLILFAVAACMSLALYEWVPHPRAARDDHRNEKPYAIVVIPDTQVYADRLPEIFEMQTAWIADNKDERNIVFVTHVGDIVDMPRDDRQWRNADRALRNLDGVVPYSVIPGNHDLNDDGSAPMFRKYFPEERLKQSHTWRGSFTDNTELYGAGSAFAEKNSYHLFSAGGQDYLAIGLEFCPPARVVAWASSLLDRYQSRQAIITTHSFLTGKAGRQNFTACVKYNSEGLMAGAELWHELIEAKKHRNIAFFLSGHDIWMETGGARRTDYVDGRPVHQLLSNYQHFINGGNGYLRLMTFYPGERKVKIETYSPYLDAYKTDPSNEFELKL